MAGGQGRRGLCNFGQGVQHTHNWSCCFGWLWSIESSCEAAAGEDCGGVVATDGDTWSQLGLSVKVVCPMENSMGHHTSTSVGVKGKVRAGRMVGVDDLRVVSCSGEECMQRAAAKIWLKRRNTPQS